MGGEYKDQREEKTRENQYRYTHWEDRQRHPSNYSPHMTWRKYPQSEHTPQQGWKKPKQRKNKNKKTHNNWNKPNQGPRDIRDPPNEPYHQVRSPEYSRGNYENRENRGEQYYEQPPYRRTPAPGAYYDGYGPPPPHMRPRERSPVYTQNYYAPLRDLCDIYRDERRDQDFRHEQGYNKSFLDWEMVYHPQRKLEQTKRKSPTRKEAAEQEKENRRRD